jgi:hypothetical protein
MAILCCVAKNSLCGTLVLNLPLVSTTLAKLVEKVAASVVDTSGAS